MLTLFVIPGLLCSAFFMGGGVYAYAAKRSVVSLVTAMAFSAMYAGCSYAILANPAGHLGYCLTAAASMFPLGLGSYKLFFQEHSTVAKRNMAIAIYSIGLAGFSFFTALLLGKKYLASTVLTHVKIA